MAKSAPPIDESRLPDWVEHYMLLPVWAMVRSIQNDCIYWVNDELARQNGQPRSWFRGRHAIDVWPDSAPWQHLDAQAVREGRAIDTIVDGRDQGGVMRWFKAHRTPIDAELILVVLDDISADLKLASMRLMLGRNMALESRTKLDQRFAHRLLEGASLDELCGNDEAKREEVRGTLALLVGEGIPHKALWRSSPPARTGEVQTEQVTVPDWVRYYDDLPIPTAVVAHASREALWINSVLAENNRQPRKALIGRKVEEIWTGAADIPWMTHEAMARGETVESVHVGRNLAGTQSWGLVRQIPLDRDQILLCAIDVTAKLRLQALRIILGLSAAGGRAPSIDDRFARLLLQGATLPNICAALELPPQTVLGNLSALMSE